MELKTIDTAKRKVANFIGTYIIPVLIFIDIILIWGGKKSDPLLADFDAPIAVYIICYLLLPILGILAYRLFMFSPINGRIILNESNIKLSKKDFVEHFNISDIKEFKLYVKPEKLFFLNKNYLSINNGVQKFEVEFYLDSMNTQNELLSLFEKWKDINPNFRRTWAWGG